MRALAVIFVFAATAFGQGVAVNPYPRPLVPAGGGSGGGGTTGTVYCNATGGAGNALSCTPSPAITSYSNLIAGFAVDAANSNATTLNISGLGAKNLFYQGSVLTSVALTGYCIGGGCAVYYDGTQLELILNPVAGNGSISTAGAGAGKVTLSGSSSGSAAIGVAAAAGTPSTVLLPATDPGGAGYTLQSSAPSGGSMQGVWTNAFPQVAASNDLVAQTTTQALLSYSVTASGVYQLSVIQFPTALVGTLAVTGAWTDEYSQAVSGFGFTSQTGNAFPQFEAIPLTLKTGTTLTVTITVTGTSTYNANAVLLRLK